MEAFNGIFSVMWQCILFLGISLMSGEQNTKIKCKQRKKGNNVCWIIGYNRGLYSSLSIFDAFTQSIYTQALMSLSISSNVK